MLLRSTNNRKKIRLRRFFEIDPHDRLLPITIGGVRNPLGRDRMLCRGEFGAAVFEKRRSIRSRRAETSDFSG
ncbi:MAG: hypothetical protein ACYCYO_14565 [Bacilli bacterium]